MYMVLEVMYYFGAILCRNKFRRRECNGSNTVCASTCYIYGPFKWHSPPRSGSRINWFQ